MFNSYIGRRFGFPVQLGDRNQISMVGDDLAIRQSIYVIVSTVPGERVMRPTFGCEIHSLIFDPANEDTAKVAERYVREAIQMWEPRITLHEVKVTPGGTEIGELMIEVNYVIKGSNDPRNLVFPYYLIPQ
jgi:phage baseplate assembly protein W